MDRLKLFFCDLETTGTDCERHGIVQIAGMIVAGRDEEPFNFRVAPFPKDDIDDEALKKNGVSRSRMRRYRKPSRVYHELSELLGRYVDKYDPRDKVFFVGYNAKFDMDFLRRFWVKNEDKYFSSWFWHPPLDLMALAAFLLSPRRALLADFKLATVAEHLGVPLENPHEAGSDIAATRSLYEQLIRRVRTFGHGGPLATPSIRARR